MNYKFGFLSISILLGLANAGPTCNLVFDKCPGDFTAGSITIPENVIWLDPTIPVCNANVQVATASNSAPPSIIFIIDNSGSMNNTDPDEARFQTTLKLLDSIYAAQPATKVGIVVFCRRLVFDHRDNSFFKSAFPSDTSQHDSYVPLTALNQVFSNTRTGLDTLKALLTPSGSGQLKYATSRPATRFSSKENLNNNRSNTRDGTDITLGFEAAKTALLGDMNAKENQYFIFLSDGEPSSLDTSRAKFEMDWVKGVNTPTTFTVFFGNKESSIDSLKSMTNHIISNGYSSENSKSKQWSTTLPANDLLSLLSTNVLNPIFANVPGKPLSAVMDVNGTKYTSNSVDAKSFIFPKRIALQPNQTQVVLNYTYQYIDSGKVKIKPIAYSVNVVRSGLAPLADGLSASCSESADISLLYNNTPITRVTADYNSVDVHVKLTPGSTCTGCQVVVQPNKTKDKETVILNPIGGIEVGNFKRETNTVPSPGDGKLQHIPSDSIIVVWTNPENPLDIVRKAFPYTDIGTALQVTDHNQVAKPTGTLSPGIEKGFLLVAPVNLVPKPASGSEINWDIIPGPLSISDSSHYVGIAVEASRAFRVSISVFTNLGQFMNKIAFSLTQAEFDKLSKGVKNNTRVIRVLWDNRASDGSLAGTGAYVMKTDVTLLKIPGIAEDQVVRSDYRIVGVVRSN